MPDPAGATPPLDEAGCAAAARASWTGCGITPRSAVIITSRAQEDWLGQVRRIEVGGLNRAEAAEYAGHLLAPYPAAQARRERRSFGELLEWLDGHPLAMRLTLPRLDTTDPADLLAGAAGHHPPAGRGRPGRGPDYLASGEHHLLLRPPGRADPAAAPGGQPVPRRRRRGRPDGLLRRRGGAGPVRRGQQAGVDGGAGGRGPGRAAHRPRRGHVPDPPGPARLPRRRLARRRPRRLRPGAGGVRAGPVHRLRRLQPVADRADRIRGRRPRLRHHRAAAADPGRDARPRPGPPRVGRRRGHRPGAG